MAVMYLTIANLKTAPADAKKAVSYMKNLETEGDLSDHYKMHKGAEAANALLHVCHLQEKAAVNRINALSMIKDANSGHPGGSLSETEILLVLYDSIMRHDPQNPSWRERDRFVLSKGHATPGLYAQLAMSGYFDGVEFPYKGEMLSGIPLLRTFRKDGGYLPGHAKLGVAGVEASTGSLGTGISIGNGMAYVMKKEIPEATGFVLVGDGELQEGQIAEAMMTSSHYCLGNLIVIVDNNGVQNDDETERTMNVHPIGDKFRANRWEVIGNSMKWEERSSPYRNGHDIVYMTNALKRAKEIGRESNAPVAVVVDTNKGSGVSYMAGKGEWHGKAPDDELYNKALYELFDKIRVVRESYDDARRFV